LTKDDPILARISDTVKLEYEKSFLFYLPRIC
jgi:nitrate reductase beta subunit